jgi:TonB-linked SusC/RagA family outer membrane protein
MAQTSPTIRGKVTEAGTARPLSSAQVNVVGTTRGALTNADGEFSIADVSPGEHTLRVRMLGYEVQQKPVSVPAEGVVTVDFTLRATALSLDEVVVTGTPGPTQKRTLGNTITTVSVADVNEKVANQTVTELLTSKVPGMTISGGAGGAGGARNIKIRGVTSLNAGNQPVVYVDGVKVANGTLGNFTAECCNSAGESQMTDALAAIAPEDIETIEVIKGPAAATLYGADAAAGVIQIITKKGKMGQQQLSWTARARYGSQEWGADEPVNWTLCDSARIASPAAWPGCAGVSPGTRLSQNVMQAHPNEIRTGALSNYSLSVRGGGDHHSFYMSGSLDDEDGILLNNFARRRSLRTNFAFSPVPEADFSVNVGFTRQHVRLPKSDDDANSIMFNSMLYRPGRANPWGNSLDPDTANMYDNQTRANTFILGAVGNYRPFSWFSNRLTIGYTSLVSEADIYYMPGRVSVKLASPDPGGFVAQQIPRTENYTVDYAGTLSANVTPSISSAFSVGAQFLSNKYHYLYADGRKLASASSRLVSSAAVTSSREEFSETNSLGFFAQEQVGLNDRLFLTAGLRMDNNSVFGDEIKRIFYPKVSASYVISDEDWFKLPRVENLRLRAAWGQAGKAPGAYAAARTYSSSVATLGDGTSAPAIAADEYGNPHLEAERGSEFEIGFDASLFDGRAGVQFTYYNKHMTNGLLPVAVSPSTGFSGSYLANLLDMTNKGIEIVLSGTPFQGNDFVWDARANISTNSNKLNSFGDDRPPSLSGNYTGVQALRPGYPVYSYFGRGPKLDANGQVMTQNGVALAGDTVYVGPSSPTREVGLSNTFTLFKNFTVFTLLDYKGGFYMFDVRDWRRAYASATEFMTNPSSDPTQVAIYKAWNGPTGFLSMPWIMPGDFIKLRDVSLTYALPSSVTDRVRLGDASVTLAAHNLAILWTKYGGLDPEANFNGANDFIRTDVWTVPQLRRYTVSLNVSF